MNGARDTGDGSLLRGDQKALAGVIRLRKALTSPDMLPALNTVAR